MEQQLILIQKTELEILDIVDDFCSKHDISYSLTYGTLIGAVRHQGFIPWDDDIDLMMMRDQYDKFIRLWQENPPDGFFLQTDETDPPYGNNFLKIRKRGTTFIQSEQEKTVSYHTGIFIDIFPVDYVSDDAQARERVFQTQKLLYKIRRCKISEENPLHSRLAYLCYKWLPVSVNCINRQIRKLIVLDKPTQTVCNMTEAGPTTARSCFPAADIASSVDIAFENRTYKTMVGYKNYLSHTYGDYMQLPPEDQRVTHHFEAYWR